MKKTERFSVELPGAQMGMMTHIITDKQTGVQYLLATFPNVGSGLTVMLDKDGKPLAPAQNG